MARYCKQDDETRGSLKLRVCLEWLRLWFPKRSLLHDVGANISGVYCLYHSSILKKIFSLPIRVNCTGALLMFCLYTCTPLSVRWANTVRSPERSAWPLLNFLQVYGSSSLRQISKLMVWSLRDIFTEGCFFYWSCLVFLIWYFLKWHKWYFTVTDYKILLKPNIAAQLSLKNIWVIVESREFLMKEIWDAESM